MMFFLQFQAINISYLYSLAGVLIAHVNLSLFLLYTNILVDLMER